MCVDLTNKHGTLSVPWHFWRAALDIAEFYGWQPAFTQPPFIIEADRDWDEEKDGQWCGGYFCNDNQLVTADDAKNISEALEKSIDNVTNSVHRPHTFHRKPPESTVSAEITNITETEFYYGVFNCYDGMCTLQELIFFLKFGSCRIR